MENKKCASRASNDWSPRECNEFGKWIEKLEIPFNVIDVQRIVRLGTANETKKSVRNAK